MSKVVFYEKPGCSNNARQKQLLVAAGHELDIRNLLAEPWNVERLRGFFGRRPVAEWFNKAAPQIKAGMLNPAALGEDEAFSLMLSDPILIRRPLMEADGRKDIGFDVETVDAWIGLGAKASGTDLETCRRPAPQHLLSPQDGPENPASISVASVAAQKDKSL